MRCLLAAVMLLYACQGLGRTCDPIGWTIQEAGFSLDAFAVNLPDRGWNGPMAEAHSKACCNAIPQLSSAVAPFWSERITRATRSGAKMDFYANRELLLSCDWLDCRSGVACDWPPYRNSTHTVNDG